MSVNGEMSDRMIRALGLLMSILAAGLAWTVSGSILLSGVIFGEEGAVPAIYLVVMATAAGLQLVGVAGSRQADYSQARSEAWVGSAILVGGMLIGLLGWGALFLPSAILSVCAAAVMQRPAHSI
jgi:hypothetical protein